jgi:hypothetical protein
MKTAEAQRTMRFRRELTFIAESFICLSETADLILGGLKS